MNWQYYFIGYAIGLVMGTLIVLFILDPLFHPKNWLVLNLWRGWRSK